MNKRLLGGLAAAGIIGGGVWGFAATLTPTSDNLGAGSDDVNSCDAAIDASYTAQYTPTGYRVATVELAGIAPLCEGETFQITLSDLANGSLVELTGPIGAAVTQSVPVGGNISAAAVNGIDVVVTGDNT